MHEPQVVCISKGKAGKKHEFGNKVSVAVTSRGGWLLGAKSFEGNPYDGGTLKAQLAQVERFVGKQVKEVYVDKGYRGHKTEQEGIEIHVDPNRRGNITKKQWKEMKRRAAVEPTIGHCKNEHRMEGNRLKGVMGDTLNALLSAASMNLQKLLRAFLRLFTKLFLWQRLPPPPQPA